MPIAANVTVLLSFTLLSNLILGYLRQGVRKRSPLWFLYVHMSIPFIIWLRLYFSFTWRIIPFTVSCAIAGQLAGGLWRKKNGQG
ncbi:MAG: hypothetical protein B6I36_11035 [Desulfobacteraceae bacterium 4572_35.1]|nr:MAG: hypothetical protein B6I36_11035 [Desulfobacteraceae bacterium 4572_35.1]